MPGYRRQSHSNKSIAESLTTTGYAVPIILINPYVAGGIFVDYLARGRFHPLLRNPEVLGPETLSKLTSPPASLENPASAGAQVRGAAPGIPAKGAAVRAAKSGLEGINDP